ncbi:MAG: hypothetical protein IT567_02485 [Alphaproteobacteria bacterium]|nr:hypothetical protein [Alphaproteobacteria bacterium]
MVTKKTASKSARKQVLHISDNRMQASELHRMVASTEWEEVRMDPDASLKPRYKGWLHDLAQVPDNSMDGIWCKSGLQRLFRHEIDGVVAHFRRILRADGVLLLALTDMQKLAGEIADNRLEGALITTSDGKRASPLDLLFGHHELLEKVGDQGIYRSAFTATTLANKLSRGGFRGIQIRREGLMLWAAGYKILDARNPRYNTEPNIVQQMSGPPEDALDIPPALWTPLGLKKKSG